MLDTGKDQNTTSYESTESPFLYQGGKLTWVFPMPVSFLAVSGAQKTVLAASSGN